MKEAAKKAASEVRKAVSVTKSFPGWLEAEDLEGGETTVTIEYVREPTKDDVGLKGAQVTKPILKFVNRTKEMILNITNARRVRKMYGTEFSKWEGKQIPLVGEVGDFFGRKNVGCIRVKKTNPNSQTKKDLF